MMTSFSFYLVIAGGSFVHPRYYERKSRVSKLKSRVGKLKKIVGALRRIFSVRKYVGLGRAARRVNRRAGSSESPP